jgi:glycosyltransferase involved in cell wall biosynthesis
MATRPRLTKSRNSDVPLHSIDSRSKLPKNDLGRSPKISIITDIADIQSIPREIRAVVRDERRIIRDFSQWSQSKDDSDACLVWLGGDRLLEGGAPNLLKRLHSADRRSFVVVNTPCVEEVPFLTIQPRIFAGAASTDYWSFRIRLESSGKSASQILADSGGPPESWAKLVEAVSAERTQPGSGVEPMLRLWESRDELPDIVGALVPRNLVAVMLLHQENANARKFLEAGTKLYPTYAELHYLSGLLAVRERRFAEAIPSLERAKSCGIAIPGSGGENSYRCDWLLGVLAAGVGEDRVAFERFLSGVKHNPTFEPSLTELLKLRLPSRLIESRQYMFSQAARWNPRLARRVFDYLLTHRAFDGARRIVRTVKLESAQREIMEGQLASAVDRTSQRSAKQPAGIVFEGPFFERSSLARVNREIAQALLSSNEFEVRLETSAPAALPAHLLPEGTALTPAVEKRLHQTNLTIRHHWPPDFRRPSTGKLAVILPWEYGGVPRVWIEQIQRNVDELWVPSNFVREVFVRNGVEPNRVTVVPNGYDPKIFRPEGPTFRPFGSRKFIFLFVGGAIRRKGMDLLLEAYESAFKASQDVTLVLLVSDGAGAYQHNSRLAEIKDAATDPDRSYILPIFESITDAALADLYRGADAFVLPYRGEGFGMPLLEAMACGKPVITTAEGPSKDFCDNSNSYIIPATAEPVPEQPPPLGPMASPFVWYEPNLAQLVKTFRHVYENPAEAVAKGRAAALSTRHLTWQNATRQYAARVRHLCKSQ